MDYNKLVAIAICARIAGGVGFAFAGAWMAIKGRPEMGLLTIVVGMLLAAVSPGKKNEQ